MGRLLSGGLSPTKRLSLAIAVPLLACSAVTLLRVLDPSVLDVSAWFDLLLAVGVVGALVGTWILVNGRRERTLTFVVGVVVYDFAIAPRANNP